MSESLSAHPRWDVECEGLLACGLERLDEWNAKRGSPVNEYRGKYAAAEAHGVPAQG